MITEKNHKLLTSQLFVTDCTKKGLASMYRLTYMLILLLINLVVFLKWDHVDSNKSLINPA